MGKLYVLMAGVSTLVRQFALPNPFESFGNAAWLCNLIAEPFIHLLALGAVGLVYQRGECPLLGCLLYLLAYASIIGILTLMGLFSFTWWWVLIIVLAMIVIAILLAKLGRWLHGETW